MDSQSVKNVEEPAHPSGYDAHKKNIKGAQATSSGGHFRSFVLSVYVTPADVRDSRGEAQRLLAGLKPFVPRLKKIWADGAYTGEKLAGWCKEQGGDGGTLKIVERSSADTEGFIVLPHR
jgi:putative transposase